MVLRAPAAAEAAFILRARSGQSAPLLPWPFFWMHFWERRFLDAGVVRYQAEFNGVFVLEGSGPSAKASSGKPYAGIGSPVGGPHS